jgi:methylated-DNA-[protein]-cysteine S-methyltransferase
MEKNDCAYYNSPLGFLEIKANDNAVTGLSFTEYEKETVPDSHHTYIIDECIRQLDEYFQGNRAVFNLELSLSGTDFQCKVWNELLKVPYGKTASYKDIAKACGNPKAVRAVGGANHNNRIAI